MKVMITKVIIIANNDDNNNNGVSINIDIDLKD